MMFWKNRVTPGKLVTMLSYAQKYGAKIDFHSKPFEHEVRISCEASEYAGGELFIIRLNDYGQFLEERYADEYEEACRFFPSVYELTEKETRKKKRQELIDSLNLTPEQKELLGL